GIPLYRFASTGFLLGSSGPIQLVKDLRSGLDQYACRWSGEHFWEMRQGGFMQRVVRWLCLGLSFIAAGGGGFAQKALTWQELRDKFETANPTLRAGQIGIDESRAQEITANLRPNPNLAILVDQIDPFSGGQPHGPFAYLLASGTVSQLWERQHKR